MANILYLICFAVWLIVTCFIMFLIMFKTLTTNKERTMGRVIDSYDSYMKILTTNMDKAFDIIYKDRILIFSIEATIPNIDEINNIAKEHAKLVLKLIGPTLREEFIYLFGDEETFLFNITEYFNNRFDEDEIRNAAQDNLLNDEGT